MSQSIGTGVSMVQIIKRFTVIGGLASETFLGGVTCNA